MNLRSNALTKTLKTLPKDFIYLAGSQLLLALMLSITVGALFVFAAVIPLYHYKAPLWAMVLGGWSAWLLFISIITIFYYVYQNRFRTKLEAVLNLLNKQMFASLGIFAFNNLLKKLHLK